MCVESRLVTASRTVSVKSAIVPALHKVGAATTAECVGEVRLDANGFLEIGDGPIMLTCRIV